MLRGQCVGKMELSKERLSVFLENVRQEMPKAHLELLHSGSLCVTAVAISAPPAHLLLGYFVSAFTAGAGERNFCVNVSKILSGCQIKFLLQSVVVKFLEMCLSLWLYRWDLSGRCVLKQNHFSTSSIYNSYQQMALLCS